MSELRKQFEALDKNKDGKLDFKEIKEILDSKMSLEECESLMKILKTMIDSNESGSIDYSEFISLTVQ